MSAYTNSDDFRKAVAGAMKLLRACFSSFQCIAYKDIFRNLGTLWKVLWVIVYHGGFHFVSCVFAKDNTV